MSHYLEIAISNVRLPETLLKYEEALHAIDSEDLRAESTLAFAKKLAVLDASAALDWAQGLSDHRLREEGINSAMSALSSEDLETAISQYEAFQDPNLRRANSPAIMDALMKQDPSQAMAWMESRPVSEVNPTTYGPLTRAWFLKDSFAASEWVGSLPDGEPREHAVEALVEGLTQATRPNFEAAYVWAQTLEGSRERSVASVFRAWLRRDRESALEALSASDLQKSVQEHLKGEQP